MAVDNDRPVLSGLLALVLVALVVGLVLGGGAVLVSQDLGLGEGEVTVADGATAQESMYLPTPETTASPSGPLLTLSTGGSAAPDRQAQESPQQQTTTKSPQKQISLSVGQNSVDRMGRIDLNGTYPGGEGAVLQVQRFEDGSWQDFPVTVSVRNRTFSTYVQTGRTGQNRFRVADTDSERVSKPVRVTVQ